MNCWLKMQGYKSHSHMVDAEKIVMNAGSWAPVICERAVERDYLQALCLMLGRDRQHCFFVKGEPIPPTMDTPPTYLVIPHLD